MIHAFEGKRPVVEATAFVHSSAHVVGDVVIGAQASIWFNAVVRGDVHPVRIGARSNLQDQMVVHVSGGRHPTVIGDDVTAGHGVILHGCIIGDRCLIGIGAVVLDAAVIENDCMIGAGSLVTPRTRIPAGHLALGRPAKAVRRLTPEELEQLRQSAARYVGYADRYRAAGIV